MSGNRAADCRAERTMSTGSAPRQSGHQSGGRFGRSGVPSASRRIAHPDPAGTRRRSLIPERPARGARTGAVRGEACGRPVPKCEPAKCKPSRPQGRSLAAARYWPRRSPSYTRAAAAAALLVAAGLGCVSLKPVVLDSKTQLENQVLGSVQRLERELVLASSVRAEGKAARKLSPLQREALDAMMIREFYRDDIEALKQAQVVGEGREGLLVQLSEPKEPEQAAQAKRLVEQENKSRTVIMRRVIQLNRDLTERDLPLVQRIFARLNRQTARPGDKVQLDGGRWEVVQQTTAAAGQEGAR
jgi:uncharacterized protein YdbL (DUF1318 family)